MATEPAQDEVEAARRRVMGRVHGAYLSNGEHSHQGMVADLAAFEAAVVHREQEAAREVDRVRVQAFERQGLLLARAEAAEAALEEARVFVKLVAEQVCDCDEAYTSRGLHEANTFHDDYEFEIEAARELEARLAK